jgi:hypothetical protein
MDEANLLPPFKKKVENEWLPKKALRRMFIIKMSKANNKQIIVHCCQLQS